MILDEGDDDVEDIVGVGADVTDDGVTDEEEGCRILLINIFEAVIENCKVSTVSNSFTI